ncbi:MAG: phosphoribosyl-ATP diphosphatase [Gammaproteobacteria bacterium]|nr:phosphoribosyl-ATP diphosphatase [Gammaproteobacteria bacterium]
MKEPTKLPTSQQVASILHELEAILKKRQSDNASDSYSSGLMRAGTSKIRRKIGEEAIEVILTPPEDNKALCSEMTDLWFHCMVLMVYNGLALDDVLEEFSRRLNISGLDEKAARQKRDHSNKDSSSNATGTDTGAS